MRPPFLSLWRAYPRHLLVCLLLGLFFFSQSFTQNAISPNPAAPLHLLIAWISSFVILSLLIVPVRWLGQRFPFSRRNWIRRALLHLTFSIAFSTLQIGLHAAVLAPLRLFTPPMWTFGGVFFTLVVVGFHQNLTTYWLILGIEYSIAHYRSLQERELTASRLHTQLVQAQLGALKVQLQPHFLFNTLNAIMVLVRQERNRQAEEMLARLSDLLRLVLEDVEAQEVPLRRELEYVRLYLSIEEVRFQDRLRVTMTSDPEVLDALVPHLALQPLVENAIRHGIGRSSSAGRIEISATRAGHQLEVRIRDDGPGLGSATASGKGIGLSNTRERLKQLYGDAGTLTLEDSAEGPGAVARLSIPFRAASHRLNNGILELHALDNPVGG